MGDQFDWQFDESLDERPSQDGLRRLRASGARFWLVAVVVVATVIGGWALLRWQQTQSTRVLVEATQASLDLLVKTAAEGDGELFFALQETDADWFAAQLRPENIAFYRAGPTISNVREAGGMLHANAVWHEDGKRYQRVLFFDGSSEQPRQVPTDPAYWGEKMEVRQVWGRLRYHEVDETWVPAVSAFVEQSVDALCAQECVAGRLPATLELRPDFLDTAEPGHITIASPRLLGLNDDGQPADRFWQTLEQRIVDYLTPAKIRFAVLPESQSSIESKLRRRVDYEAAAEVFMAEHPDIRIELVSMDGSPDFPEKLQDIDGAAFVPSIETISGGEVVDLTPYMLSDPDFDRLDFYEQVWQGAVWEDRLWIMPQAAQMPLIFYQREAFRAAGLEEPLIGWTWTELSDTALRLQDAETSYGVLTWGYLDQSLDSLFSFAFNNQSLCRRIESRPCPLPLSHEDVAAAFAWYVRVAGDDGFMPDPSGMHEDDRTRLLINSIFHAAIWADEPIYFEHRTTYFPMGVLPFPGSDHFTSSTPLWIQGSFISQNSKRPLATWQWIKFLSSWPPMARYRLIPARPSVGQETDFWTRLPRPLVEPMRAAFPLARPVSLADRTIFSWPLVRAVMDEQITPRQAAEKAGDFPWFGK